MVKQKAKPSKPKIDAKNLRTTSRSEAAIYLTLGRTVSTTGRGVIVAKEFLTQKQKKDLKKNLKFYADYL